MLSFAPMPAVPSLPPEEPIRRRPIQRKIALSPSQGLGIIGSALLLLGLYLPFESGSSGLASGEHGNGSVEATIIAAAAVLSFVLAIRHCSPALAATAMIAQMAFAFAALLALERIERPGPPSALSPGDNLICAAPSPPHATPGLGWYFLLLGPLVLLVAAVADDVVAARSPGRRLGPDSLPPLDGRSPDCV